MRLLVTGGTGFIGRSLLTEVSKRGWSATVLTRPGRGEVLRRAVEGNSEIRILEGCTHSDLMFAPPYDALINLVGPKEDSWIANWEANVVYVRSLTTLLKRMPVARVVHFSSVSVYGPSRRGWGAIIREDDRLTPDDWYGVTKVLGERIMRQFHEGTGTPVTVLRPSWVMGQGSHLLDRYLLAAAKAKVSVRMLQAAPLNAVYVKDVAHAGLSAASAGISGYRVYNINGTAEERFGDFLQALHREVPGRKVPLFLPAALVRGLAVGFGSLRFLLSGVVVDATKAREELGFEPRYDIGMLVQDMINAP